MLDDASAADRTSDSQVGLAQSKPYVLLDPTTGEIKPVPIDPVDPSPADEHDHKPNWAWIAGGAGLVAGGLLLMRRRSGRTPRSARQVRPPMGGPEPDAIHELAARVVAAQRLLPYQDRSERRARRGAGILAQAPAALTGLIGFALQNGLAAGVASRVADKRLPLDQSARVVQTGAVRSQRSTLKGQAALAAKSPRPQSWWDLIKTTINDWQQDGAMELAAALAYYMVFSLAPLLMISLAIAGLLGQDAHHEISRQLQSLLGSDGAAAVDDLLGSAQRPARGAVVTILGVAILLFGASGVFGQLQSSLNKIWGVKPRPDRGWLGIIKDRFISFTMVLGIGFLLLVSLVLSAILAFAGDFITRAVLPNSEALVQAINFGGSFVVVTLLFAMIYKVLPDVEIQWRDVWLGAVVTSLLFAVGKYLIGFYIGQAAVASSYGAAGSVIVVLLWAYYSALILFLGAEFTQAYARMRGLRIAPARGAVPVEDECHA